MELFSKDEVTGLDTYWQYDDLTGTFILEYRQDTEPLLEQNKAMANDDDYTKAGMKGEMWHYASVPNSLIVKWLVEDGIDFYDDNDWPKVLRKLNDPEYRYLTTTSRMHV